MGRLLRSYTGIFMVVAAMLLCSKAAAQGGAPHVSLYDHNNDTIVLTGEGIYLYTDAVNGNVQPTYDHWTALKGSCIAPMQMSLAVEAFDVGSRDTLYIYDGPTPSAPLLYKGNNDYNPLLRNQLIFGSQLNTSGMLTVRYHKICDTTYCVGTGVRLQSMCRMPCEIPTPHIDSVFYKMRNGVVTDTMTMHYETAFDTTIHVEADTWDSAGRVLHYDTTYSVDTIVFRAVNICKGDQVLLRGYGTYTNTYGYYAPTDATSLFRWNLGNGDTLVDLCATDAIGTYRDLDCYDVILQIIDEQGCPSSAYESVRVRLAQMPIKTIYDLPTICNVDSVLVNVSYEGENGAITLKKMEFEQMKSKTYEALRFCPDGPRCSIPCFDAAITFSDFPAGRTVTSPEDICSICVNYEHEFMGDYTMAIICPLGERRSRTILKSKDGGGTYTGYPYGGNTCRSFDGGTGHECDSLYNYYGVGLDYCFSRNVNYMSMDSITCNDPTHSSASYLNKTSNRGWIDEVTYTFPTIPSPFIRAGQTAGEKTFRTARPSNHAEKTGYYIPDSTYERLVGCPLNGTWQIQICDTWGLDNGWIFNWSLDICGISAGGGCKYQVGLDKVVWTPDSAYGDWDNLYYRGAIVRHVDSVNSYISSPDTAGYFPFNVHIIDEFGCIWDTVCAITTVWTPTPELGDDTTLCSIETIKLDARDRHTASQNQSFMWEPLGQDTPEIQTEALRNSSTLYTVQVTNEMENIRCRTRDSLRVNVHEQPTPNFDPGIYPLEGCEPLEMNITNTSVGGARYHWDFGDGDTSNAKDPSHVYRAGVYNFKYYVTSENGCQDSLIYDSLITVYPSPKARFSWSPVNPTVLHPSVTFENRTEPQSEQNDYFWEIQYDKDNPISYQTLTEVNPSYTWKTDGKDISGNYIARLIARTSTMGPSGQLVECRDTIQNKILLVNDYLQFPNLVSPNGDGVNDRFVIKGLVEGKGYPNNSLAIYNRWGKRVYYKENISNDEDFWDPAASHMPDGTYFWRFSGKGYLGNIERTGTVEVVK